MKKIMVFITVIISFMLSSCGVSRYDRYDNANKYSVGNFSYDSSVIKEIEINWVSGDITIIESDKQELNVSENAEDLKDNAKMHYYIKGSTLYIKYAKSRYFGHIDSDQKKLRIEVPKNIDLEIDSVSSDIDISTITLDSLKIENVSGNVNVKGLDTQSIDVESVSGDIEIDNLKCSNINVESVSGDIVLGLYQSTDIDIETVSGKVKLSLLIEMGFILNYETTSGKVKTDLPCIINGNSYKYLDGNCEIDIETVSGNIEIN